ncbi:PREDICTED: uncharacterized protein LOC106741127 isoform X8 [Dinoponera quadriceps]|uniref:Uncharacterized protein LOC106741127 isoform X8 n=1 Tax=Dinoponera quadriceps TaxID=609295 RepID=A0A6P3WQJ1_DINQU|nr:PREDICTED: uncharacterized protein LOC106741127 isoform X8 [Dinoponera quadriceps]
MTSRCKLNFCRRRGVVDSERSSRNPNTSRRNRHPARISISQDFSTARLPDAKRTPCEGRLPISGYLFRGAFASIRSRAYRGTKPPCLSRRASG